ncbi:MAG: tetratricopeptide repeat protein [Calditrichia bacterium]
MKNKLYGMMLFVTGILLLLSCSGSKPAKENSLPTDESSFSFYYRALSEMEQHRYPAALALLDSAIAQRPQFAQFYFAKGEVLNLSGKKKEAIQAYENALLNKSYYPDVWPVLARLYVKENQFGKAAQIYKNMVAEYPDSLSLILKLAEAYLNEGESGTALNQVNAYVSRSGESPEVSRLKGLAYLQQKNYERSIEHLQRYLAQNDTSFRIHKALGIALIEDGKLEKGMTHLNRAYQMNAEDSEIYIYRAIYFKAQNKPRIAEEQLNLGLKRDSSNYKLYLEKGKLQLEQGDTLLAGQTFREALSIQEKCWECYRFLGIIADQQGRLRQALEFLQVYDRHTLQKDPEVEQRLKRLRKSRQ